MLTLLISAFLYIKPMQPSNQPNVKFGERFDWKDPKPKRNKHE